MGRRKIMTILCGSYFLSPLWKGSPLPLTFNTSPQRHYAVNLVVDHRGTDKTKSGPEFSSLSVIPQMLEAKREKRKKRKEKKRRVDKRQARRHVIISIFNGVLNPQTSFISSLGHEDKTWPSFNWFITCVKGREEDRTRRQGNEARRCSDR